VGHVSRIAPARFGPVARPRLGPPSVDVGVGHSPRRAIENSDGRPRLCVLFPDPLPLDPYGVAVGVGYSALWLPETGDAEDPVAEVRGADGGSGYTIPFRIKPERVQVSQDVAESSAEESGDVFGDDPGGSEGGDDGGHVGPEPAGVFLGLLRARLRDGLAGEAAGDHVNGRAGLLSQPPGDAGSDVGMAGHLGPVCGEDAAAERV